MEKIVGIKYRNYWMGISILLIMLLHLVYIREDNSFIYKILKMIFIQGNCGVNLFFFLSAYGLCHSYSKNRLTHFYQNRIKRIFPIYACFVIAFLLLRGNAITIDAFLYRILGISTFLPNSITDWYVPALIILYITFPLIYQFVKKLKELGWIYIYAFIVFTAFTYYSINNIVHPSLWSRWSVIILGIATYLYGQEKSEKSLIALYTLTAALSLFFYNDCEFYFYLPLVLWGISKTDFHFPFQKTISFFGKHSLELYLGQIIGIQYYFLELHGNFWIDSLIALAISFIAAFVLWAIQYSFEHFIYSRL